MDKYALKREALEDLRKLKQELLSDTAWRRGNAGLVVAALSRTGVMISTLFNDIAALHESTQAMSAAVEATLCTADGIRDGVERASARGRDVVDTATEVAKNCGETAAKKVIERYVKPYGKIEQILTTIENLKMNIEKIQVIGSDHQGLRSAVTDAVARLDREIQNYQRALRDSGEKIAAMNKFKNEMDRLCSRANDRVQIGGEQKNPPVADSTKQPQKDCQERKQASSGSQTYQEWKRFMGKHFDGSPKGAC